MNKNLLLREFLSKNGWKPSNFDSRLEWIDFFTMCNKIYQMGVDSNENVKK